MRDAPFLKWRQNGQGKDDHIVPGRAMPDQLFQFFIADVVFVGRGAVEDANNLSLKLRNEEAVRE